MLRRSFLKHFRLSGKLVTVGSFRGLATRHSGAFLASFGKLFQSPSEGRARAPGSFKKRKYDNLGVLTSIVCSVHVCDECTTRYVYDEWLVYGTGWGDREIPPSPG